MADVLDKEAEELSIETSDNTATSVENADSETVEEAKDLVAQSVEKVQLDLDDAPFLEDDEPEPEPVAEAVPSELPKEENDSDLELELAKKKKRKKIIIAISGFVLLIVAAAVTWFFVFSEPPPPPPPEIQPTVIVVPSAEKLAGPKEYMVAFEPFFVPQSINGEIQFLQVVFSGATLEQELAQEMQDKSLVLRDAIYYYLRNKSHDYLTDATNLATIKQDLLNIVNNYVTADELEELFIENYLME